MDPSTVSRQVAQLVALGLVERRADPDDGRASLLVATDTGRRVHAEMKERRDGVFSLMVADWPAEDVRRLAELLARFNDTVASNRSQLITALAGDDTAAARTA